MHFKNIAIYFFVKWRKVGITSSLHGLYELGYRRATMIITKRCKNVNFSKSLKIILVRIVDWNSSTWSWNR